MLTLRERLEQPSRFLIGTELVSVRGGMGERSAIKARNVRQPARRMPGH